MKGTCAASLGSEAPATDLGPRRGRRGVSLGLDLAGVVLEFLEVLEGVEGGCAIKVDF